ncbi:hypothetical protein WN66_03596 [Saccharomyces cerevisiae]|uniref:Putative uncharacterized protein YJR018W n=1 Tax=Saccharomyces cerevisiae (strain ATCC 204508 / S288c) TaxID=559292 RepID=YJY8_YEAST|nr:RecName: Full=Putative uncharacterized protein YJR018W [Saccharomyces cerevisiae S288C]KZV10289.1 hypothetical protein WN66_03596 [Saccharomyces cerevisiae]WNV73421.1 hypothetical protein O6U65_1347 [Saccharomyces cerevisiae synthetic construct]CAA60940.1 ORF YJR83.14 [Saccharomyces cerevisiae]CAA89542.1 unnamed protein product [Saccharomyces cerevisiae]
MFSDLCDAGLLESLCLMRMCRHLTRTGWSLKCLCSWSLLVPSGSSHCECFVSGLKKYSLFLDLLYLTVHGVGSPVLDATSDGIGASLWCRSRLCVGISTTMIIQVLFLLRSKGKRYDTRS